ncbi:MAG: serine hydrolase [Saprospiraceae bacterium]|nr:serine hydrolase [Saprospiraceae bacterium]
MKKLKFFSTLLTCFIIIILTNAQNQNSIRLNAMIEQGMKDWKIPGLSAIVVKDGEVVFQKSYGVRDKEANLPVDNNTLFAMASTTKAIVAMSLGMLVDQGKIKWTDKVRDHLPAFKLSDVYVSADARVKDLLTHNLGIENADLLWVLDSMSTAQTVERFSLANKVYPLRGGYTYQNIMFVIAGQLIEAVSGHHWTDFVSQNIFKRLEMTRTRAKSTDIISAGNYTYPYFNDSEDGIVRMNHTFSDQIGSAGMIWSCTNDIGNYLRFLVNNGVYKGDTLLRPATFGYLFKPQSMLPDEGAYPTNALTKPKWNTYGLGWFQQDYKGTKLDFHTGSLSGLVAIAGLVRDHNMAVYVFANLDHAELRHAIMYKAIDLFVFGDDSRDWHAETFKLYEEIQQKELDTLKKRKDGRVMNTKPSLNINQYAGIYKNQMLGKLTVSVKNEKLNLNFNDYRSYDAEHWHFDTFITSKNQRSRSESLFNFILDQSGKAESVEIFGKKFPRE